MEVVANSGNYLLSASDKRRGGEGMGAICPVEYATSCSSRLAHTVALQIDVGGQRCKAGVRGSGSAGVVVLVLVYN